jgi:hypothetical protein
MAIAGRDSHMTDAPSDMFSEAYTQALARLQRTQKSQNYRSFFIQDAVEEFSRVEGSAFAGKSIKALQHIDPDEDAS